MEKIKAYKAKNGCIYEKKEDAIIADKKRQDRIDFDILVSKQSYPKNYGTSFGNWDCEKSPVKKCVYDYDSPMRDDDCIYCHNPDERK